MKRAFKISFALAAAILLLGESAATAQMGRGRGPGTRMYNPATEITLHGTIERVQKNAKPFQSESGMNRRYRRDPHLILFMKTRSGRYTVLVGPTPYVEAQRFQFHRGEWIEVTGSKQADKDGNAVVARKIRRRGRTLILRNPRGIPEWSMSPRR